MGMNSLIVVGAGYAGALAAHRAASRGLEVTLVNEGDALVDRIRLHEVIAGTRAAQQARRSLAAMPVRLLVGRADHVGDGVVRLSSGETLAADHVLLATGSTGGVGSWSWAQTHRRAVESLGAGASVRVLGAGLTGIETVTELASSRSDLRVGLVDPRGVGAGLSDPARGYLDAVLDRLRVESCTALADEPADHIIDCTGFTTDTLARDSGLSVDDRGRILVGDDLRVPDHDRLWACGDAAVVEGQPFLRWACASAGPMGAHAADNIVRVSHGRRAEPVSIGFVAKALSLGRRDGLLDWARRDDTPKGHVWTGRRAAYAKELVCRFAVAAPLGWPRSYRWMKGPHD